MVSGGDGIAEVAQCQTLVEILRWRALHQPDRCAYLFLTDGEQEEVITYAQLDAQARSIATNLRRLVGAGERVLLLYPSSLEYISAFFGCLYAGVVAVPVYPPRSSQHIGRIEAIVLDAQPAIVLTTRTLSTALQRSFASIPGLKALHLETTDTTPVTPMDRWSEPTVTKDMLAFLQYTSGSTGTPKGVMVTHANLMHNSAMIRTYANHNEQTISVSWLPMFHDMGLIAGVLQSIYVGFMAVLMAPDAFLQRPLRWLQAITRYGGNTTYAPNFAYELCVQRITAEEKATLDLGNWRVAANGAEPVRMATIEAFIAAFQSCGFRRETFYPCYGLAEATLFVSSKSRVVAPTYYTVSSKELSDGRVVGAAAEDGHTQTLVSSGCVWRDQQIVIVDPEKHIVCPPDQVGEIWVSGPSIARGYWQRPAETSATFGAFLVDGGAGPFMRTGDLGFLHGDDLFVTGRLKDLIIIRGQNYYPQDIEDVAECSHVALKRHCSAAFALEVDGEERVILVMEIDRQHRRRDPQEIFAAIRQVVLEEQHLHIYGIVLIKPSSILKTSSGKIQRRACHKAFVEQTLAVMFADLPQAVLDLIEQQRKPTSAIVEDRPSQTAEVVAVTQSSERKNVQFSLLYFSSNDTEVAGNKYELLLEGAKFADQHDFTAVWVPERHFHPFGGLYPNPSVLASALAAVTQKIRLRAGSVVLPMHHPIRVAEEWAVVDNLSSGRVDVAFAIGWNPNDFVLAPTNYASRKEVFYSSIETFQRLWRGETVVLPNGLGKETAIKVYPLPRQPQLIPWITCSGSVERFTEAGAIGANVLTALLFQSLEELAAKIKAYRDARAQHGYDPASGHVTLMLHTFIGEDIDEVRQKVRRPFIEYLKSSVDLWRNNSTKLDGLAPHEQEQVLSYAFERYFQTHALIGTPQTGKKMIERLSIIGVDEIACLIDFGVDTEAVMESFYSLNILRKRYQKEFAGQKQVVEQSETVTPILTTPAKPTASASTGVAEYSSEKTLHSMRQDQPLVQQLLHAPQQQQQILEHYLQQQMAQILQRDVAEVASVLNIRSLGLDSLMVMSIVNNCQRDLRITPDAGQFYERTSFNSLAAYLVEEFQRAHPRGMVKEGASTVQIVPRRKLQTVFPVSFAQQRLWFLHQIQPHSAAYNVLTVLGIQGDLVVDALEWSLQAIIRRHESLRTTFILHEGRPVQAIHETTAFTLAKIELYHLDAATRDIEVRRLTRLEGQAPFDMTQGPLIRATLLVLDQHEYVLLLTYHHIVSDGWSRGIFLRELQELYTAHLTNQEAHLAPLPIQYADFAVWQREWLNSPGNMDTPEQEKQRSGHQPTVLEKQLAYWKTQLAGPLPTLELPTDYPRPPVQTFHGAHLLIHLPEPLMESLKELSKGEEATLFMTLMASFQLILARYSGQTDILVGTPIAGRNRAEIEPLIGFFVNTLVLRTNLAGNPSFRELLQRVRDICLGAYANQEVPFEQVVDAVHPERDLSRYPLFQVMFVLEESSWWLEAALPGVSLQQLPTESGVSTFDLTWSITSRGLGEIEYNTDLFEERTIRQLLTHWQVLLEQIVADPQQHLLDIPLLTPAERQQVLGDWNATNEAYPLCTTDALCMHHIVEQQARRTPAAVAILTPDACLTYWEVERRANQVAHALTSLGVDAEARVGVCMERSPQAIIGLLGILKAGGVYVPLDPHYPQDRLEFMVADAQLAVILTQEKIQHRLLAQNVPTLCLESAWFQTCGESVEPHHKEIGLDQLAYLIYTSGSTGRPKGVQVSHCGIHNLVEVQTRAFDLQPEDHILQFSSMSFDASVWEVCMALGTGATLCLDTENVLLAGPSLQQTLEMLAVSVITLPPSILAALPDEGLAQLRTIVVAGEACQRDLVERWATKYNLFNAYGPTEGTVCATFTQCHAGSSSAPSIGRPIARTQVYILDEQLETVPIGVIGEIYIGGVHLARGYLHQEDLTAERFVPHPFSKERGARLYKTGDLARYSADGNIHYIGRKDHQVKLRGFRIELGEIETVIGQYPGVREVIVLIREDTPGDRRLVAYLTPHEENAMRQLDQSQLRQFVKQRLPNYMVPSAFVVLPAFPLTPNGKVDRQLLARFKTESERSATEVALPSTEVERTIATIWQEVLRVEKVGKYENFFDLGGHSLLVIDVVQRLKEAFQRDIALIDLFEHTTVAALARYLSQTDQQQEAAQEVNVEEDLKAGKQRLLAQRQRRVKELENSYEG
jgi:natural product biosynthesis luciferase-like monooxygenase protein/amino acid adenylation domain-containing protein